MHVVSFVNDKGGCGKTTTAIHLGGELARRGRRVLVVDLDPQAHATLGLSCDAEGAPSSFEVLTGRVPAFAALRRAPGGVVVLPSHARLAEFEELATRDLASETCLRRALGTLAGSFDDVLLDCPPRAAGILSANALVASSTAVLTVETGAFALQGALRARSVVDAVAREHGLVLEVRMLATLFECRVRIAREILVAMHARFGAQLYDTAIRTSARLREAAALGAPVQVTAPRSAAAADFEALAAEWLARAPGNGAEARPGAPRVSSRSSRASSRG
ncbi:MAG: ParA family protein [Planctomycetes bacterium]|nr:ParA family protein [Planctomycetota bacterium]